MAELARLIGQTDPFGTMGRAKPQVPSRPGPREPFQPPREQYQQPREQYQEPVEPDDAPPAGPPPWMQRANRQEIPRQEPPPEYPSAVHPLQRYAAARAAPEPDYEQEPQYADDYREPDPSRYDEALYDQIDDGRQSHNPGYAEDDAYGYQDGYDEGAEEQVRKRRGGTVTVAVVLALAVLGTGAAFAYRTYIGSPRSGEVPIIKADTSPTKVVPTPSDGSAKLPDRMAATDGTEKIVPREEAPVDLNTKAGPRVVFPPLNSNVNPPSAASVAPSTPLPPSSANGTLPNNEPRKIKTLTVRGDQPDSAAAPATSAPPPATTAKQAPARTPSRNPPASANASANAPLSLAPQGAPAAAEPRTPVANAAPVQTAPSAAASGGGYLVQVSSQRSEADAQATFRTLQGKYPDVLGSHQPLIRRADLGEKGVYYRAMVGPFGTPEEASQFCGSLKTAGGQCVVQRN